MEQNRPLLITSEEIAKLPILIVDKKGMIGGALAKILRDQFLVVVVTAHELDRHDNVIHVPYHKKIPMIPDNAYSHLFVIYNGENELLDMLPAFEEKSAEVRARLLFVTSLLYSNAKLFTKLRRQEFHFLQTVLYGEIFDNQISEANETNFFVHQTRSYGRIEVPKEGLGILYPVSFDDVLTSLVSLAFAVERPKDIIYLFPHHAYNEITVARILQKIDPTVRVDFSKRKSDSQRYYIPSGGMYYFRDYNLEERLRKIDLSRIGRRSQVPQKKIQLKMPHPKVRQGRWKVITTVFLAVFIAPLVLVFLCALLGAGLLSLSLKQVEQGNFPAAESAASVSQLSFATAQILAPTLFLPQLVVPQQKTQFLNTLQTGKTVATTTVAFIQAAQLMKNIYEGKSQEPQTDFSHSLTTIKNTLLTMQKLEAENALPQPVLRKLHLFDGAINMIEETIDTWPSILGFAGKKNYLILFQNNMELRPGGGFIGSYGILPIENGRMEKLQIQDVYDADGHLTEHIQPPYGLQRYLGVSHWFLRDSNFDLDFTHDAGQAAVFLQKETGQRVNGVIAIDTNFLKNLISVVGSVYVPDYRVIVTSDNFYLLTETNAEKNFFPGSTQKKDFLRSLTTALMDKMSVRDGVSYEKLAEMVLTSIQQKDILFTFSDPDVQNVFTVNDLSSSLWDGRAFQKNTAYDYTGIVDANVGQNKANYYVKRSLTQSVVINDLGGLQTTAAATYTNTSTKTSPFGGDYKDYVRFVIPATATLTGVTIDNKQIQTIPAITDPSVFTSPNFTPPPSLEIEQSTEEEKNLVGFFFIVPVGVTRTISISYLVPGNIDVSSVAYGYTAHVFKQPGAGNDPYQLSLSYPADATVVASDNGFTNVGGKILYEGQLSQDRDFSATFAKK